MVHILPHWTWPGLEGAVIPVIAYSNCARVELFLDGQSLGVQPVGEAMNLRWDVAYRPGTLKAVGYRGDGSAATCIRATAAAPAAIRLACDETTMRADRTGIAHVIATVVDARGRLAPHANHDIAFIVEGAARLIGLENGDPLDTTNYKLNHRRAFHGMMLAIVQAGAETGTVTVRARAAGLQGAACAIQTVR
jgi:beta-galactosidase